MARVLINFAHPALEKSRIHQQLVRVIKSVPGITFNDLYEHYPDFDVDVDREQDLLLRHDIILLQHPFYWYSAPALIKQWQDLVLEHGWAYGHSGKYLKDKLITNVFSAGGPESAYQPDGHNHHTVRQFLAPFTETARLCNMHYLPPYAILGAHRMDLPDVTEAASQYRIMLEWLRDDHFTRDELLHPDMLQQLLPPSKTLH